MKKILQEYSIFFVGGFDTGLSRIFTPCSS